jgi:uncharacterized membrane protein
MSTFSAAVDINAPAEKVFAVLCDVENWPQWTSSMTRVRRLDRGPLSMGSTARVEQPKLLPATWQVTEFDANRNFTWTTRMPGLEMKAGHWVQPQGNGSHVKLTFQFDGFVAPLISRFYAALIEKYMTAESQGLKKRSEPAGS